MAKACIALSKTRKATPPSALAWFFEKTSPQNTVSPSLPPSRYTAPPLPPSPISWLAVEGHLLAELVFCPLPVAVLLTKLLV